MGGSEKGMLCSSWTEVSARYGDTSRGECVLTRLGSQILVAFFNIEYYFSLNGNRVDISKRQVIFSNLDVTVIGLLHYFTIFDFRTYSNVYHVLHFLD